MPARSRPLRLRAVSSKSVMGMSYLLFQLALAAHRLLVIVHARGGGHVLEEQQGPFMVQGHLATPRRKRSSRRRGIWARVEQAEVHQRPEEQRGLAEALFVEAISSPVFAQQVHQAGEAEHRLAVAGVHVDGPLEVLHRAEGVPPVGHDAAFLVAVFGPGGGFAGDGGEQLVGPVRVAGLTDDAGLFQLALDRVVAVVGGGLEGVDGAVPVLRLIRAWAR